MRIALGCLASGSSGNSYLIKTDTTAVLVDAGLSGKQIFERLEAFGVGDAPAGVLVTHEHSDHIKGLPVLMKKKVPVYANESTARAVSDGRFSSGAFVRFATGDSFWVGDIRVSSFPYPTTRRIRWAFPSKRTEPAYP